MSERNSDLTAAVFSGFIDLASEKLGGKVLLANDEFFAEKENLIKPGRGVWIADKYTERGKWMDGWETRRKRVPGYDWCILKLGTSGVIEGVDIDTNNFLGNHPPYASIDALSLDKDLSNDKLQEANWTEILPKSPLKQGSQNIFGIPNTNRWTHIRLNIYPDGGVARLKVYGTVQKDWQAYPRDEQVDLAAVENGGSVVACNDMFFGNINNMIMPGSGVNMGDGWETRRRRDPGHDWSIVRLAHAGFLKKLEVDTKHYKGNFPDSCWVDACYAPSAEMNKLNADSFEWTKIVAQTKLQADHRHFYEKEIMAEGPWTHLRLNIVPDGGISRFRAWCTVAPTAAKERKQEKSDGLKEYQRT
ncbi:MAG: allantoicase [Cyanobacteria bacterium SZAS-4]|nr:allantoicase [Cyanobacteria bacterium SZAS-4]